MTDRKPHKWMEVITAWAKGAVIQYRVFRPTLQDSLGAWSVWMEHPEGHAPMRTDMYCEYRVRPNTEPHKWQREKEAFLAGKPVQFRANEYGEGTWDGAWRRVEQYLVDHCNQTLCSEKQEVIPLWDREWLDFRIQPEADRVVEGVLIFDNEHVRFFRGGRQAANARLMFKDGKLVAASVL